MLLRHQYEFEHRCYCERAFGFMFSECAILNTGRSDFDQSDSEFSIRKSTRTPAIVLRYNYTHVIDKLVFEDDYNIPEHEHYDKRCVRKVLLSK